MTSTMIYVLATVGAFVIGWFVLDWIFKFIEYLWCGKQPKGRW